MSSERSLQLIYVIGPPHSEKLQQHDFGPEDLKSLADAVDGFSLMTYDFSNPHSPGPNAPLKWIRSTLQLLRGTTSNSVRTLGRKIFLGINFYGNDFILSGGMTLLRIHMSSRFFSSALFRMKSEERFGFLIYDIRGSNLPFGHADRGGGAITGRDYLSLLEKHRPIFQWEKNSGEHFFFYSDDVDNRHAVFYPSLMSISLRLEEAHKWGCGISIWEIGQGLDYFFDLL